MKKIILFLVAFLFITALSSAGAGEMQKSDYPSVMVLIEDYINGVKQAGRVSAAEMERVFERNNFPVVAKTEAAKINLMDLLPVFTVNPAKIAAIGKKYASDAVIIGCATSNVVETDLPYGTGACQYKAFIEARVVRTDNAHVLAMDRVIGVEVGADTEKNVTSKRALSGAARQLSKTLMSKIIRSWNADLYDETDIRIICENATPDKVELLKKAFRFMEGVKIVSERTIEKHVVEINVIFLGLSEWLVKLLANLEEPLMDITAHGPNQIYLSFVKEKKDFTKE